MTEVVVKTGVTRRAKLQSVTTNKPTPSLLQAGCPSCRQTNSVRALKGLLKATPYISKIYTFTTSGIVNLQQNIIHNASVRS